MGSASALRLELPADVATFEATVHPFLLPREAENCLILGLAAQLRTGATTLRASAPYFAVLRSGNAVVGAALVAGFIAILSEPFAPEGLPLLVADLRRAAPELPGVSGPVVTSALFAEQWTAATGQSQRLNMSERIFRLERVIPPRRVAGHLRETRMGDRDLIADWLRAFAVEALAVVDTRADEMAGRWIEANGRAMYLWDVEGRVVSMVGVSGETPHGIRVAPVYTPPELRRRGYASALTAAVSRRQLDGGKTACFLYTDLANPTSNKIYQAIGYEPVIDVADRRFAIS